MFYTICLIHLIFKLIWFLCYELDILVLLNFTFKFTNLYFVFWLLESLNSSLYVFQSICLISQLLRILTIYAKYRQVKLLPVHATKAYMERGFIFPLILNVALDGFKELASRKDRFIPGIRVSYTHWIRGFGPQLQPGPL